MSNTPPQAFGLDISDDSIKIAQFRKRGANVIIDVLISANLPKDTIINGEIKQPDILTNSIKETIEPYKKILSKGVIASLPEPKTFIEVITIPKKEDVLFAAALTEAIPEYVPFLIDEIYFDTKLIEENDKAWKVVIGAAPKYTVDDYLLAIDKAGLIPMVLDIEATSIANSVIPNTETTPKTRAIIDLGQRRASLIVHDFGTVQFTMSLPIASETITESIASGLDLTKQQAEKTKLMCGLHPEKCEGILRQILEDMVNKLVDRIQDGRKYYLNHFQQNRDIEEIILCGGGAHLLSLDKVLSDTLSLPTRTGNMWQNIKVRNVEKIDSELRFATVTGLAIRALNHNNDL